MYFIGIDTGVKTGFAVWDSVDGSFLEISTFNIVEAMSRALYWVALAKEHGRNLAIVLEDAFPQEITLMAPGTGSGLVNIHCNVSDARILIDGEDRGTAPCILKLDASHLYELVVYKPGYKDWKTSFRPRGNGQIDIQVKLKKR